MVSHDTDQHNVYLKGLRSHLRLMICFTTSFEHNALCIRLPSCDASSLLDTASVPDFKALTGRPCWYEYAYMFLCLHRGAKLHCHWCGAANVFNLHRVNTARPCSDSPAAARLEVESHHHPVLHCTMLLWLLAAAIHHAGGSKDHE